MEQLQKTVFGVMLFFITIQITFSQSGSVYDPLQTDQFDRLGISQVGRISNTAVSL